MNDRRQSSRGRGGRRFRGGFSFTEILFAVIILGIGFIMVAAIFPVAIQQGKATAEESTGAAIARGGLNYMEQLGLASDSLTSPLLPATGSATAPHRGLTQQLSATAANPAWQQIRGNLILPDDPRYAWVVLYRRDGLLTDPRTWSPFAQVFLIPVQIRNRSIHQTGTPNDLQAAAAAQPANLQARPVRVEIINDGAGVGTDLIRIDDDTVAGAKEAAAEGSYLIIRDDGLAAASAGWMNGRIYRLGIRRTDLDTGNPQHWELAPGFDFNIDPGPNGLPENGAGDDIAGLPNATAWIVGRGYLNPVTGATDGYEGTAREVAAYTTWVNLK